MLTMITMQRRVIIDDGDEGDFKEVMKLAKAQEYFY